MQSRQVIEIPKGCIIPLSIQGGPVYMESSYPTDQNLETYPHVYMTSNCEWDPTVFDNSHDDSIYDSINFQNGQIIKKIISIVTIIYFLLFQNIMI